MDKGKIVLSEGYEIPIRGLGENRNILITGTSGCGKTTGIVQPTIESCDPCSLIIIDPKGALYMRYADYLKAVGYDVYNINLINPEKSNCGFNPLSGVQTDMDILKISDMIVYSGLEDRDNKAVDPYWNICASQLLSIILDMAMFDAADGINAPNLTCINRYLDILDTDEDGSFAKRIEKMPKHRLATKQFGKFAKVFRAEKTTACILSVLASVVGKWNSREVSSFLSKRNLDINKLAQKKGAVFIKISDTNDSLYPLATLILEYYINSLFEHADRMESCSLEIPVQFILDDYSSNVTIKGMPRYTSTCRSRNIGFMLCIQSLSQLVKAHGEDSKTIANNCEYSVFFSSTDIETCRDMSQRMNIPVSEAFTFPTDKVAIIKRGYNPKILKRIPYYGLNKRSLFIGKL